MTHPLSRTIESPCSTTRSKQRASETGAYHVSILCGLLNAMDRFGGTKRPAVAADVEEGAQVHVHLVGEDDVVEHPFHAIVRDRLRLGARPCTNSDCLIVSRSGRRNEFGMAVEMGEKAGK